MRHTPSRFASLPFPFGIALFACALVALLSFHTHSEEPAANAPAGEKLLSADERFFQERAEPILAKHCYSCHSGTSESLKAELRLDIPSGWKKGGESGEAAIVPGDVEKSALLRAIRYEDLEMPPGKKLSEEEISILTQWVKTGAVDNRADAPVTQAVDKTKWWSLEKLTKPAIPQPAQPIVGWDKNPIDLFLLAELQKQGLSPNAAADRRTRMI